jgi:hypothetical protein
VIKRKAEIAAEERRKEAERRRLESERLHAWKTLTFINTGSRYLKQHTRIFRRDHQESSCSA